MKRPSFQFYPGDWTSNPNLKRCTFAEKGVWLEVMCLMHDQVEYGVLRWPLKEIAEAVKCKVAELQALIRKDVLKGDDKHLHTPFVYVPRSGRKDGEPVTLVDTQGGPIWYSSRMVKDEYVRIQRAESSGNGETPKASPKSAPKPPFGEAIGGGIGPHGSSSPSSPSGNASEANASDGEAVEVELTKAELWSAGKSLLETQGMPKAQCGSFVGKLVKDYGDEVVIEAVRTTVVERPADAATFLVGVCKHAAGKRGTKANGKHAGFENMDYHQGVAQDGSLV